MESPRNITPNLPSLRLRHLLRTRSLKGPAMKTLELPRRWPDPAPTEILPGLWQGGTSESSLLGQPTRPGHYRGKRPFDIIVTLYADAQPEPWCVEEI